MALVLVLIFGVAAFALALTMLTLSSAGAQAQGSQHRDKNLQAIVRYGLATAVNEVNRTRKSGAYDPTGNGAGAILVGPDGARGWPVYDHSTPPRLLGRFTAIIVEQDGHVPGTKRRVLQLVAVEGNFPANAAELDARFNDGRLRYMTAEVEVESWGFGFDRNALSIRGPASRGFSSGTGGFRALGNKSDGTGTPTANQVKIKVTPNADGLPDVPAVNITDKDTFDTFTDSAQLAAWAELTGRDPATSTWAVNRKDTVTQSEAGLLNQDTMNEIAQGVNDRVATVMSTGTPLITAAGGKIDASGAMTDSVDVGEGTFYINTPLTVTKVLKGKGTLVINKGVEIKATLDWDGDVIIANNKDANVYVGSGGNMYVSNVLTVQGVGFTEPTEMGVRIKGDLYVGTATKAGTYLILGDANTKNPLRFDSGASGAHVNGIFSIMGNALSMSFGSGAKIFVDGSMALITPTDATKGVDIALSNADHVELRYTKTSFDGSVAALGGFFTPGDGSTDPVQLTSWLEDASKRKDLIEAHVTADTSANHGLE